MRRRSLGVLGLIESGLRDCMVEMTEARCVVTDPEGYYCRLVHAVWNALNSAGPHIPHPPHLHHAPKTWKLRYSAARSAAEKSPNSTALLVQVGTDIISLLPYQVYRCRAYAILISCSHQRDD